MILRELFYFDKETLQPVENDRYDPAYDTSILKPSDTRKTRLTLRQIGRARKAAELLYNMGYKNTRFIDRSYLSLMPGSS